MTITKETTPFEFLENDSWECDDLYDVIVKNNLENAFNEYVDAVFEGQSPSETELNDFLRFEGSYIKAELGLDDEDNPFEDSDDE